MLFLNTIERGRSERLTNVPFLRVVVGGQFTNLVQRQDEQQLPELLARWNQLNAEMIDPVWTPR